MHGPDLTNSVVEVLSKFKQYPIALIADIKQMLSQVLVDERDRDALRFVWFPDNDLDKPPIEYQRQTHVFGAKLSPCCSAFASQSTSKR